jgi:hypothetical protein
LPESAGNIDGLAFSPRLQEHPMRRVTGIGGIFFSARDPGTMRAWYKRHLGFDVQDWGGAAFAWADAEGKPAHGTTVCSIGAADGKHFAPSTSTCMVNYRVEDLSSLLQALRDEGCDVLAVPARARVFVRNQARWGIGTIGYCSGCARFHHVTSRLAPIPGTHSKEERERLKTQMPPAVVFPVDGGVQ